MEKHLSRAAFAFGLGLIAATAPAQSSRPGWGSIPYSDSGGGVTFRVWAPNATNAYVPGEFNGWSTTATPMAQEGATGVWSVDVPAAIVGQQYKYLFGIGGTNVWKRDARSRKVVHSGDNSIIYDPAAFNWAGDSFTAPPLEDAVIYEMHIGTFPGSSVPSKFIAATNYLDYLKQLGVNVVELMPICEFPGDVSWGYNPSDPFTVENIGYGGPDGFKTFVKACHQKGIAVMIDIVHNHYGPGDLDLWNYDGWTGDGAGGGIYFYQDAGICCTGYGSRPNYSRQPVRDYIQDNFKMWLDEYRVDGFRWDTPGLMINADGYGTVNEAITLIQQINTMIHNNYSGKLDIAEDVTGNGFDSTWSGSFHGAVTAQLTPTADSSRDMNTISNQVNVSGFSRVVFLASHDQVGSLNPGAIRVPTAIDGTTPDSYVARKRSTLGAAITFTAPGVPLFFQGEEMLENAQFIDTVPVDWTKTNTYSGIVRLYNDLIHLRRNLTGTTAGLKGDQVSMLQTDNSNKLVAYRRWKNSTPTNDVVVIANFANTTWNNYVLPFPRAGTWYVHFNSDSTNYASDYGNVGVQTMTATGSPNASAVITIAPYSALILSQTPDLPSPTLAITRTNSAVTVSWPVAYGAWVLDKTTTLTGAPPPWGQVSSSQYQTNATSIYTTVNPATGNAYYRLRKP